MTSQQGDTLPDNHAGDQCNGDHDGDVQHDALPDMLNVGVDCSGLDHKGAGTTRTFRH